MRRSPKRGVQRRTEDARAAVSGGAGQVLQALGQREELTEGIPAEVVLLQELLHSVLAVQVP